NGLQIDFHRILQPGLSQTISQIQVDSSSTDTFQVMCRVNNVNDLFKISTLSVQFKANANAQVYTDLARLQNIDATDTVTYQKPVLASGAGSIWTVGGSFGSNSYGKDSTLGVSRAVSSITCSNTVEYRCHLLYSMPAPGYNYASGIISKELDVKVLPTTITRQVYNMSGLNSSFPIAISDKIEFFYVGQTVKMECSANIGSYNGTAQIRWLKSNIVPGSPLAPFYSPDAVLGDPQSTGNCVYQQTDSVTYNIMAQDASRTADNRLHFQCYVYIPDITEESGSESATTADPRRETSGDYTEQVTQVPTSTGTVTVELFGGVVGGVVALAVVVVAVVFISRRYWVPSRHTSDNTENTKTQSHPVFETQTAPPYDNLTSRERTDYTEIGMTADGPFGPNNETSSYERLHIKENAAYTGLESNNAQRYEKEIQPRQTYASPYDHVYTAPLEHHYTPLDAIK
ncbi:hypothetical protein MAR_021270, partial [Mya arenaria]